MPPTSQISSRLQMTFFIILLVAVVVLTFFVLQPYLAPVVLAATLAILVKPVYQWLTGFLGKRPSVAALVTTVLVTIVIVAPLFLLSSLVVDEATQLYSEFSGGLSNGTLLKKLHETLGPLGSGFIPSVSELDRYAQEATGLIIQNLGSLFSNAVGVVFAFFITLFGLYYFLKDGNHFKQALIAFSPLKDSDDEEIIKRLVGTVRAVVLGSLMVAVIQGVLASIGFAVFGVPSPVLLGLIAVVVSLIPSLGTAMITVPAVLFLFFTGPILPAIGLLIWSVLVVGTVDNFLRPKLIERGMNIHPLFIFLSVLGGLQFFGAIGFLLGPLVLSFFFALLSLYQKDFRGMWE